MFTLKNFFYTLVFSLSFLSFGGCSSLDVGFEENSVFHSPKEQKNFKSAIVNVYLDKSTKSIDKFRLVINAEDTELNLYYGAITRFEINQASTNIDLFKNNVKVMSIHLDLKNGKNYFLIVKKDKKSQLPIIEQINKHQITKGTKSTPIFVSEKVEKEDKIKQIKQKKDDFVTKKDIGLKKNEKVLTKKAKNIEKSSIMSSKKSLQEQYESGETIFYYDPDDGE